MKCSSHAMKALILFLLIIFFFSCGGDVVVRPPAEEHEFTVNGVVVKDMNTGKDIAYFSILKSGAPFDVAIVKVNNDTLDNQGNGNYYLEGFPLFNYGQNVSISVSSAADQFSLITSRQIPGSFQITEINHATITSAQSEDVRVTYGTSGGASGYFYSVVRPDGSDGFTALVQPAQFGDTPIQRDAFYNGLDVFVTGTYQVFLIAYNSSFIYYPGMEFYVPGGLPSGNLTGANGAIGAGVVAASASIEAVD